LKERGENHHPLPLRVLPLGRGRVLKLPSLARRGSPQGGVVGLKRRMTTSGMQDDNIRCAVGHGVPCPDGWLNKIIPHNNHHVYTKKHTKQHNHKKKSLFTLDS